MSNPLRSICLELEAHVAESGWDGPARLFALVPTAELVQQEPDLGLDPESAALTPVENELDPTVSLEAVLETATWPAAVAGCAAVVERVVLPPSADADVPEDPLAAAEYAAAHPEREEVRLVAAVTRDGDAWCALRMRAHDDRASVADGPDLVPVLVEMLRQTLVDVED